MFLKGHSIGRGVPGTTSWKNASWERAARSFQIWCANFRNYLELLKSPRNGCLWPLSNGWHQMRMGHPLKVMGTHFGPSNSQRVKSKLMNSQQVCRPEIRGWYPRLGPTLDFYLFSMYLLHLDMNTAFKNEEIITVQPTLKHWNKVHPWNLTWKRKIIPFGSWKSSSKPAFFGVPYEFSRVHAPQHWCHTATCRFSWGCCACWICGGPSPQRARTALALVDVHRGAGSVVWYPGACNGWDDSSFRACGVGSWKGQVGMSQLVKSV